MMKSELCGTEEQESSEIATEVQNFLSDLGLEATYEYKDSLQHDEFSPFRMLYSAEIILPQDLEDSETFLEAFEEGSYELLEQLRTEYPNVKFSLVMSTSGSESSNAHEEDFDDYDDFSEEESDFTEDDSPAAQYREEGLRIIDDIEEEHQALNDRSQDEADGEDEDYQEPEPAIRREEADSVDDFYSEEEEEEYIPSAEDREELWKAFGNFEDD